MFANQFKMNNSKQFYKVTKFQKILTESIKFTNIFKEIKNIYFMLEYIENLFYKDQKDRNFLQ